MADKYLASRIPVEEFFGGYFLPGGHQGRPGQCFIIMVSEAKKLTSFTLQSYYNLRKNLVFLWLTD